MAAVHIVFGQQGAGKTKYAQTLAETANGTRFSIDEWMSELFGPDMPTPLDVPWIMARVARCERRIWAVASEVARRGGAVVLDLGFMKAADRARFVALASEAGLDVRTHFVTAPLEVRRVRVMARNATKGETFAFEVTPGMFDFMETHFELPNEREREACVVTDTR